MSSRFRSPVKNQKKKVVNKVEKIEEEPVIETEKAEDVLTNYDYIPLTTIIINDNKNNFKNKYVKAINKMGQKVYILIDNDNKNLNYDLILMETNNGNTIPFSLKNGSLNLAGMDVSGIMFECDKNGLCLLENVVNENNENMSTLESNYKLVEDNKKSSIIENDGGYLNYPVVKLSEIKINNNLVIESSNNVTKKLRNISYKNNLEELYNMYDSIENLQKTQNQLFNIIKNNSKNLKETIETLEDWNRYYIENPPETEIDIKKNNNIIHNLRIRNDYINYIICGMNQISEYIPKINEINDTMNDYINFYEEEFENLKLANNLD